MPPIPQASAFAAEHDLLEEIQQGLKDGLRAEIETAEATGLVNLVRAFVQLRALKDHLEETLKPVSAAYEHLKTVTLPQRFDAEGVPSIPLDEGYRVTVAHTVRASIKGGKKEEAITWLQEHGLEDIVTPSVNSATLSAVARTMAEENRELDPDLFTVAVIPTTSVTKTK